MAGDYTRLTHEPLKGYSGVRLQQGRVQLDADWNEQLDIIARRWRVQAKDTFGAAAVSRLSTKDAFALTWVSAKTGLDLKIGVGRMYVDGLIAEVFEEDRHTYLNQKFLPDPSPLPTSDNALAYVDVWEREVTHIQDPDLLEKALGGPDTTTRRQTVWQVKLYPMSETPTCDFDLDKQFPPSAGKLTTDAIVPQPSNETCVLSPEGGYRGLENRLYRVEIHEGGGFKTAKFKWSRDNASVVSSISEITVSGSQTVLKVSRIGRDKVLRFGVGDWVEITDDHRELMGEAGEMAQIAAPPDEANLTITLNRAIPAFGSNKTQIEERHTRVIRWDQTSKNKLDNDGLITLDNTQVQLEDGVYVTFSLNPTNGEVKVGDYWVFAARTADGSVEKLENEPPRGIHHHYATLAVITDFSGKTDPQNCRHLVPECGGGCCSVSVEPGEDIQAAINSLPGEGGCVCLRSGKHHISAPIRIDRSHIVLIGECPGTRVVAAGLDVLLAVGSAKGELVSDVEIEAIRFEVEQPADKGTFIAHFNNGHRIALRRCGLEFNQKDALMPVGGVFVSNATDVTIEENRFNRLFYGIWVSECLGRHTIAANTIVAESAQFPFGWQGIIVATEVAGMCRIEANHILNYWTGILIEKGASGTLVVDNRVEPGSVALAVPPKSPYFYGIAVYARDCKVSGNYLNLRSSLWGGIQATTAPRVAIMDNTIEAPAGGGEQDVQPARMPIGILCQTATDRASVYDNVLTGPQSGIILTGVAGAQVLRNRVEGPSDRRGIGALIVDCDDTVVGENMLRCVGLGVGFANGEGNAARENDIIMTGIAIEFNEERDIEIASNRIEDTCGGGIVVSGLRGSADISYNRVANCGYVSWPIGIGVVSFDVLDPTKVESSVWIHGCEVIDTGVRPGGTVVPATPAWGIFAWVPACRVTNNRTSYTPGSSPDGEHRALLLWGPIAYREANSSSALIVDNVFTGPGLTHLVELQHNPIPLPEPFDFRFEKVTFANNVCDHRNAEGEGATTVLLWGSHLIVTCNHVKGDPGVKAIDLWNLGKVALVGNVTTGEIVRVANTVRPSPHADFNVKI